MKVLSPFAYLVSLILCIGPLFTGCGVFQNQYKKNSEGFYERHYYGCGPVALEKAINEFYRKQGIVFVRNPAPRKEISQAIQRTGMSVKKALCYFDKEAIAITWTGEMKHVADKYGFELITVGDLNDLDLEKDIAIVLIHGKLFSNQYHWVVFPIDDVEGFYGDKTVIDTVYLLKQKKTK